MSKKIFLFVSLLILVLFSVFVVAKVDYDSKFFDFDKNADNIFNEKDMDYWIGGYKYQVLNPKNILYIVDKVPEDGKFRCDKNDIKSCLNIPLYTDKEDAAEARSLFILDAFAPAPLKVYPIDSSKDKIFSYDFLALSNSIKGADVTGSAIVNSITSLPSGLGQTSLISNCAELLGNYYSGKFEGDPYGSKGVCVADNGVKISVSVGCGDGICNSGEFSSVCPADCGSYCGDKVCNGEETEESCSSDCKQPVPSSGAGASSSSDTSVGEVDDANSVNTETGGSSDSTSSSSGSNTANDDTGYTPPPVPPFCGDGTCTEGESIGSCPGDCTPTIPPNIVPEICENVACPAYQLPLGSSCTSVPTFGGCCTGYSCTKNEEVIEEVIEEVTDDEIPDDFPDVDIFEVIDAACDADGLNVNLGSNTANDIEILPVALTGNAIVARCGDGKCTVAEGESSTSCPADCGKLLAGGYSLDIDPNKENIDCPGESDEEVIINPECKPVICAMPPIYNEKLELGIKCSSDDQFADNCPVCASKLFCDDGTEIIVDVVIPPVCDKSVQCKPTPKGCSSTQNFDENGCLTGCDFEPLPGSFATCEDVIPVEIVQWQFTGVVGASPSTLITGAPGSSYALGSTANFKVEGVVGQSVGSSGGNLGSGGLTGGAVNNIGITGNAIGITGNQVYTPPPLTTGTGFYIDSISDRVGTWGVFTANGGPDHHLRISLSASTPHTKTLRYATLVHKVFGEAWSTLNSAPNPYNSNAYPLVLMNGATQLITANGQQIPLAIGSATTPLVLDVYVEKVEPFAGGTLTFTFTDGTQTNITLSSIPAPQTCSSFTYSNWSVCQSNGQQTRTVVTSSPTGCTVGNPVLTQSCAYTPPPLTTGTGGGSSCGNGVCDINLGEDSTNCPVDCSSTPSPGPTPTPTPTPSPSPAPGPISGGSITIGNTPVCTLGNANCGNGVRETGEACDAGSANGQACIPKYDPSGTSCSYCTATCTVATVAGPFCGDGNVDGPSGVWSGEQCDLGAQNGLIGPGTGNCQYCDGSCRCVTNNIGPYCGDGICNSGESSLSCPIDCGSPPPTSYCGDGILDSGESCDAGSANGQVCSANYGTSCSYCTSLCSTGNIQGPYCGDGTCSAIYGETSVSCLIDCPVIPDTSPPACGLLTVFRVTNTEVYLSWNIPFDNVGVVGYSLYRSLTSGQPKTLIAGGPNALNFNLTGTSHIDIGLTPSTDYYYEIKAFDAAGNLGGACNEAKGTTTSVPLVSAFNMTINSPIRSQVINVSTVNFQFTLNQIGGSVKYTLNGGLTNRTTSVDAGGYVFTNVNTGMTNGAYTLTAYGYNASGYMLTGTIPFSVAIASTLAGASIDLGKGWNYFAVPESPTAVVGGTGGSQGPVTNAPKELDLASGWNLIGYSGVNNVPQTTLEFKGTDNTYKDIATASKEKRIQRRVVEYSSNNQNFEYSLSTQTQEGKAYWVYAREVGKLKAPNVDHPVQQGKPVLVNQIQFQNKTSGEIKTLFEALNVRWVGIQGQTIDQAVRLWNAQNKRYETLSLTDNLDNWRGYVLWGNSKDIRMIVPNA